MNSRWGVAAIVGGLAYPFLVYFGMTALPPAALVLIALGLIALRMAGFSGLAGRMVSLAIIAVAVLALVFLLLVSPYLAVKIYPVAVSLGTALLFLLSLRFPPTAIERIARLTQPDLPPAGIAYTRKVTQVWIGFLIGNAFVSALTALWGSLELWTLWNGLLSYLAMGGLFVGELLVRRRVQRRISTP
ncbi:hypothetical protein [Telmatospirillum sp.]|uniref:COG4648 family protein n=1 Tax=Telmatospirillum sp. TaxID=2079197 RepID=UPI00283D5581|nr:hypothetical protein [Telmatospirillum sp.]MDR3439081.1 hypothetical protein [Telmatospirillum sp.]